MSLCSLLTGEQLDEAVERDWKRFAGGHLRKFFGEGGSGTPGSEASSSSGGGGMHLVGPWDVIRVMVCEGVELTQASSVSVRARA